MPRFNQDRRDPKSERLAQLAAIAQIYQGMQGPQMRQQAEQQQTALATLGLLMQNQSQQARLAQDQSQFEAAQQGQETRGDQAMELELLRNALGDPNTPLDQKRAVAASLNPKLGQAVDAMHQAGIKADIQKRAPEFQAVYSKNQGDPTKLKSALDAMRITMPQATFEGQDWTGLNQSLPAPQPPAPSIFSGMFGGGVPDPLATPADNSPITAINQREGLRRNPLIEMLRRALFRPAPSTIKLPPNVTPQDYGFPN